MEKETVWWRLKEKNMRLGSKRAGVGIGSKKETEINLIEYSGRESIVQLMFNGLGV